MTKQEIEEIMNNHAYYDRDGQYVIGITDAAAAIAEKQEKEMIDLIIQLSPVHVSAEFAKSYLDTFRANQIQQTKNG